MRRRSEDGDSNPPGVAIERMVGLAAAEADDEGER